MIMGIGLMNAVGVKHESYFQQFTCLPEYSHVATNQVFSGQLAY